MCIFMTAYTVCAQIELFHRQVPQQCQCLFKDNYIMFMTLHFIFEWGWSGWFLHADGGIGRLRRPADESFSADIDY